MAMMNLHGSLVENLEAALESTRRLRGQRVYSDTIQFWSDLLETARRVLATVIDVNSPAVASLADQLEEELRGFVRPAGGPPSSDGPDGLIPRMAPQAQKSQAAGSAAR
jgi:hypothetical protein